MSNAPFTIVSLEQRTNTWLNWRHNGIGASDASSIMGENRFKSADELHREKIGPVKDSVLNAAMALGIELEPEARRLYIKQTGKVVHPVCIQSAEYTWMRASLDGLSVDKESAVEIKCGKTAYFYALEHHRVPDYYYGQLQHILAVTGLASLDYWSYWPGYNPILIRVPRDNSYIALLIKTELDFWNQIQWRKNATGSRPPSVSLRPDVVTSEMEPPAANPPTAPQRRARVVPVAIPLGVPLKDEPSPPLTWREYLLGPEGRSFSISLLVHLLLLALLAIPLSREMSRKADIVPIIEVIEGVEGDDALGDFIDAPVLTMQKATGLEDFEAPRFDEGTSGFSLPINGALADSAGSSGSEDGEGTMDLAGAVGGYLLREPGNAVKAGRFTAFSRPIIVTGVGNKTREEFGEPGEAPLAGQAYFIVIQIRVDPRRKTYLIGDLIGSVVGTDGYTQKVPEGMYILDDEGKPQEIKRSKPIKVVDSIVQLLMRVPGAKSEVRDNIYLKSKMLKEEQNLQLIFQSQSQAPPQ